MVGRAAVLKDVEVRAEADVFKTATDQIAASFKRVDRVYELEEMLPPAEGDDNGPVDARVTEFAETLLRNATDFTATVWYSAWTNSAEIELPEFHHLKIGARR